MIVIKIRMIITISMLAKNHDQRAEKKITISMLTNYWFQGMGMIAASLLLFLKEDDTFWMMACIVQVRLGSSSTNRIKSDQS